MMVKNLQIELFQFLKNCSRNLTLVENESGTWIFQFHWRNAENPAHRYTKTVNTIVLNDPILYADVGIDDCDNVNVNISAKLR